MAALTETEKKLDLKDTNNLNDAAHTEEIKLPINATQEKDLGSAAKGMPTSKRIYINITFIVIAFLIVIAINHFLPEPEIQEYKEELDEATKESIGLLKEMNKYLTTIAFVIIGLLGNIIIGKVQLNHKENPFTVVLFFSSIGFSLISIFYGYLVYSSIFQIVSYHIMNIHDPQIGYSNSGQFMTLLISAFLFIWYVLNIYISHYKK